MKDTVLIKGKEGTPGWKYPKSLQLQKHNSREGDYAASLEKCSRPIKQWQQKVEVENLILLLLLFIWNENISLGQEREIVQQLRAPDALIGDLHSGPAATW